MEAAARPAAPPRRDASSRVARWSLPLAAVVALVLLWTQIRAGGVPGIDLLARGWSHRHQVPAAFNALNRVKDLGRSSLALPVLLLVAAGLAVARSTTKPLVVAASSVFGLGVTTILLKRLVARPGPSGVGPPAVEGAWPSGHATTIVVVVLTLVALFGISRSAVLLPLWMAPTAVGAGLVYCGHHWLTDVLAAVPLGYLIVRAGTSVADRIYRSTDGVSGDGVRADRLPGRSALTSGAVSTTTTERTTARTTASTTARAIHIRHQPVGRAADGPNRAGDT